MKDSYEMQNIVHHYDDERQGVQKQPPKKEDYVIKNKYSIAHYLVTREQTKLYFYQSNLCSNLNYKNYELVKSYFKLQQHRK